MIVDQAHLPGSLVQREIRTVDELVEAIRNLRVRGAPALAQAGRETTAPWWSTPTATPARWRASSGGPPSASSGPCTAAAGLALAAARHGVPFVVVAAPESTIDPAVPDGTAIPIEERAPVEVFASGRCQRRRTAPPSATRPSTSPRAETGAAGGIPRR